MAVHLGEDLCPARRSTQSSSASRHSHGLDRSATGSSPSYRPTKPSDCNQPARAASAISRLRDLPLPTRSRSGARSAGHQLVASPAGTKRPVPTPLRRQTRWSAVTSSRWPALVWRRSTGLRPLALTATICVTPLASNTFARPRWSSTSRPIGTQAVRRAHEGVNTAGRHSPAAARPATPMLNHTGELNAAFWWMMRYFSSSLKTRASSSSTK